MINFEDIFKTSFLDSVASFSFLDMLIAMALALAVGLFIFLVYKKTYMGVLYSNSFGVSLVIMTLITTLIILAVTSNIILSLGMVGALSIVRFRTAVKEPLDIAYLFWSIAAGIVLGAGLLPLGVFGSLFIGIIMVIFVSRKTRDNPYLLIATCQSDAAEELVMKTLSASVKKLAVKSKTVSSSSIELTVEVRLKELSTDFVNRIAALEGVNSAVFVSYNGEYLS